MNSAPHSNIAEQALLGAIFINNEVLNDVIPLVSDADFYSYQHRLIFGSMKTLFNAGGAVEPLSIADILEANNQLDDAGGLEYVSGLLVNASSAKNAVRYATTVREKSNQRKMLKLTQELQDRISTGGDHTATMKELDALRDSQRAAGDIPFRLDQFALNGQASTMEAAMLDDIFILGNMAILGQSTVFYAKPNAGKTLITIWLIIEAIKTGKIKGEDIFYINADDNHKGLTYKLKLAERYGFMMLAPGYNGFKAETLAQVLTAMIQSNEARGKVLVLDTVKKFTDIMRKDKASKFGEAVRQFVAHGGSVIMLAHVNKHRDDEGKVIFSGTSDLVDDVDCAYTLDTVTEEKATGIRTVIFENFKSRGDVEAESVYQYNFSSGTSYHARLDSVRAVTDTEREAVEQRSRIEATYERNREAVEAIREAIRDGVTQKTDLIKAAMERSGLSRKRIIKALGDHTGTNSIDHQYWTANKEDRNAHVYRLNLSS